MKFRSFLVAGATGALALPALAGGLKQVPLQQASGGIRVSPNFVQRVEIVDGQLVVGERIPYTGAQSRVEKTLIWDSFEPDPNGVPTGADVCDSSAPGSPPCFAPDTRWYFGTGYNNPLVANDIILTDAAAYGSNGSRLEPAWWWGGAEGTGGASDCVLVIFTGEDFDPNCGDPPYGGFFPGVAYTFLGLPPGGYYYSDIDLSADPNLYHEMPADGSGVMLWAIADSVAGGVIDLNTSLGTQPMLWGCGDAMDPTEPRPGTQTPTQYDDDAPTDGDHVPAVECYSYDYTGVTVAACGGTYELCPHVLSAMICFYAKLGGCSGCPDVTDDAGGPPDGSVTTGDLAALLGDFGGAPSAGNECLDTTDDSGGPPDGLITTGDLALLLGLFGSTCP